MRADLIAVPGAAVRPDGSPSPALRRRVEAGVALWQAGVAPKLVVSGGVVTFPPAEGLVGTALAAELGVPEEALIAEVLATDTLDNARQVAQLGLGPRVVVVTDDVHLARALLCFGRFFAQVHGVGCRSPRRWQRLPRELGALVSDAWRSRDLRPAGPDGP